MAQLEILMEQADVIAAIQLWAAAQTPPHQINAAATPTIMQGPGGTFQMLVLLNN
jgi:hypothetical protein